MRESSVCTDVTPYTSSVSAAPEAIARATVAQMARSLDFYLALGCEVRRAADGWGELAWEQTWFVLVHAEPRTASPVGSGAGPAFVRLSTPDVRALRRGLLAQGIPSRTVRHGGTGPCPIEITDPDLHRIVIRQARTAVDPTGPGRLTDCARRGLSPGRRRGPVRGRH